MHGPDVGRQTPATQAWCAASCSYKHHWPRHVYNLREQNEMFVITVNRWVQEIINEAAIPAAEVCALWLSTAEASTTQGISRPLSMCGRSCAGPVPKAAVARMSEDPCNLYAGHVSLNPVQIVHMPLVVGPEGNVAVRRRLLFVFTLIAMAVVMGSGVLIGNAIKSGSASGADVALPTARELLRIFS